jgi:hypothetical protein
MNSREQLSLDGVWQFSFDTKGNATSEEISDWRQARVPMPWQAQFEDLREQAGTAWYRRSFQAPAGWAGQAVILHFGAVYYYAEVWLNGQRLGEHEGGYLPFEFEISPWLRADQANELVVRVVAPTNDRKQYPQFPFAEIPHGKQSWYGFLSGLWQSVWLECRASLHVQSLTLQAALTTGQIEAILTLSTPASEGIRAQVNILNSEGAVVAGVEASLPAGATTVTLTATVPGPLAWSPDQPHLYRLELQLWEGNSRLDSLEKHFGFRTIEAREGRLFLNGEPIYLRGALDQDYYPDTIAIPPSEAFLEDQFRKAKAMGLNCLRCHIKVADPRYYDMADRVGLLIWTELPNWRVLTPQAAERGRETLAGIVARDGHHPSIIIWTIINEDWGTDLTRNGEHRAWLKESYHWLKALDPTRLVVDNSPCKPNFHVQTDLDDYHHYRAIPDHRSLWDEFVDEFSARSDWSFSPYGDAVRTGQEPLLVSEFGNWGLPDVELLREEGGRDPWWFETGLEWGEGVVYPHGVQRRFDIWNLEQVFGNWKAFVEATQWQEYLALKYEIEAMRRQSNIVGYVITEFTDVHWECNGLLDMRRNPKAFYADFGAINADTVIIPEWVRVAYWAGESVQVGLTVSHGAGPALSEGVLHWHLEGAGAAGQVEVPTLEAGQVETVGAAVFMAPEVTAPTVRRLNLELRTANGRQLASNHLDLALFPERTGPLKPDISLWTPERTLATRLRDLGYRVTSTIRTADAVVATKLNKMLDTYIKEGGRLLLLATPNSGVEQYLPGVRVLSRAGTQWQGDWASSFTWIRREGPLAALPGGPLIDHSFDQIIPEYVLSGFGPLDFEAQVHAGLFVGWIHRSVALIGERRYGRGLAVVTTFPLIGSVLRNDPTAATLLDALVALTVK